MIGFLIEEVLVTKCYSLGSVSIIKPQKYNARFEFPNSSKKEEKKKKPEKK